MDSIMSTYARLPVTFERGEGAYLYDTEGKKYLDAMCGIAVTSLGHAHAGIAEAVCDQVNKLIHTSNLYNIENQGRLGKKLCELSGLNSVFFANSGAEANEAAIKLARLYGKSLGIEAPNIIVMDGSFHGRTLATLSATGSRKVRAGFSPLLSGFVRVPYNDIAAIQTTAKNNKDVVAILVEPIQGEGGIIVPNEGYLKSLRVICDENNWLLMVDEIQSGMSRTGEWFGFQHENIMPDVMTLAKSTRAGLAVIEAMEASDIKRNAGQMGKYLHGQLQENLGRLDGVNLIRSKGLMLGVELDRDCGVLVMQALEAGLLINVTAGNVVRLLPPLTLTTKEADEITRILTTLITTFLETR